MGLGAAIQGGVGTGLGVAKFFEGRKMQRSAQRFIDNFEWKDLNNAYENLQVSTLGSDLMREENARASATAMNTLRQGGNRAIIGGTGRIVAQNNNMNRQIAADLDQQQKNIDYAVAGDDAVIRGMEEKRQADELQGYGQMLNTGLGMKWGGLSDMINGMGALGQGIMSYSSMGLNQGSPYGNPKVDGLETMTVSPMNLPINQYSPSSLNLTKV